MNSEKISSTTLLTRKQDQVFSIIDDEILMLSVKNAEYYSLNDIGGFIWFNLENPISFSTLIENILNNFDVPQSICEFETMEFIHALYNKGLIIIDNETN